MWHEARRSERKVHDLMDAARRRAQRRAAYLARRRGDPHQSIQASGTRCRVHRDDALYQATEDQQGLIPWNGKQDILIDRFDGRALLDFIRDTSSRPFRVQEKSEEEEELEEFVNFERYRDLIKHRRRGFSDETGLQHVAQELEAKAVLPFSFEKPQSSQAPASKGAYSQVGYSYKVDGNEDSEDQNSDDEDEEEEDDEDDKDFSSDDSSDERMENIAKEFGVKRYNWLVYMDKKAKEEEKRQKEIIKGDPSIKKLSRRERRKASQIERERERETARSVGRASYRDPYREQRRSPSYEAYSRGRRSRSRSRSRSPSYYRRHARGIHAESNYRSKTKPPRVEYITEFGGSDDTSELKVAGISPPSSPIRVHIPNRSSGGQILEALHSDPASSLSVEQERSAKILKPLTSTSSALAKLSKGASGGPGKTPQTEKKETPQERLKRIMSKQLNKQIRKDTAAEIAKKREQERPNPRSLARSRTVRAHAGRRWPSPEKEEGQRAAMEEAVRLDLDKLPIKRLEAIDEAGNEHYPPDTSSEEQRLAAIRRIDFSWVIEKDAKKAKKAADDTAQQAWPWQGLVENLQQAQQELSVVIDLISTVEANDAVAVATTQKPKSLPNETLVDMAVSAATKLQRLRHLSRYFKQSAKTMEQQFQKEARFYGSLIRLQQNWKVKKQRFGATGPGSEGFMFDLADSSHLDAAAIPPLSSLFLVPIDQDSSGTLSVQVPQKACRFLSLQFRGDSASNAENYACKMKAGISSITSAAENDASENDDVNKSVKHTNSILRNIHKSIFEEQVFDMVTRETFIQPQGINVTGMREDFLQLAIGQECSLCLSLAHSGQDSDSEMIGNEDHTNSVDSSSLVLATVNGKHEPFKSDLSGSPNPKSLKIYLLHMFHENTLRKVRDKSRNAVRYQNPAPVASVDCGLLGHFCMTVAHRIFYNKVHLELESVVSRVPYLHLRSLPTWHSRTSSWSLCLKVPQRILVADRLMKPSDNHEPKYKSRSQFNTKVILKDGQISLMGEGSPSIAGSLSGKPSDGYLINSYNCDLEDLPTMLLQQVASQVIHWLHEEALVLGMNVTRDFLCLYFDLDQGETLGLVAHVDPDDAYGCISWYLTVDHPTEDGKISTDNPELEKRRFLGYLSLEVLYSTLMDLINLCSAGIHH